jgi:hypothetical protein
MATCDAAVTAAAFCNPPVVRKMGNAIPPGRPDLDRRSVSAGPGRIGTLTTHPLAQKKALDPERERGGGSSVSAELRARDKFCCLAVGWRL